jgi:hypothetical protein
VDPLLDLQLVFVELERERRHGSSGQTVCREQDRYGSAPVKARPTSIAEIRVTS